MKYAEYEQKIQFLKVDLQNISELLETKPIKRWAYMVHDRDRHGEEGPLKDPHIHIMMELNSDQVPANLSKWFEDTPEHIEKAKSNKKAYENMCSYLIHDIGNKPGDFHYDPEEVAANFDFPAFIEDIRNQVKQSKTNKTNYLEEILVQICENRIPRLKLDQYITDLDRIKYARYIEKAYEIRDERIAKEVERDMNVMYFTGGAGTGKTTMAKYLAKQKGYDVFVSGSSNDPLQGYLGQECIILDDLRGSDWKINDLLKFLDNNTNSLVKSRYSNKLLNDCKLIIITSVQSISELYKNLQDNKSEPITQLMRRCSDYVKFTNSTLEMYQYNQESKNYVHVADVPNMTSQIYFLKEHTSQLSSLQKAIESLENEPF